jgi:XRE family transcriptional regulator, fatty acid utilization regulator
MGVAKRLKFARDAMDLTLSQVAERTGIAPPSLSEFETGKREPKLVQLRQLAEAYRRSTSFFLDESELTPEVVLWRQKPTSPSLEEIRADLISLAEQYHNLELWCDDFQVTNLPMAVGQAAAFNYASAETLAYQFRKRYSLGDMPGQTLLRVVEEVCKVKVFHLGFDPTGSAACTLNERYGAAILLNSKNVPWRRNFDLAHELFHLLTWNVFRQVGAAQGDEPSEKEEKLATCFARNLLMPQEALKSAVATQLGERKKLTFDDLFEIARQFDVSMEALVWHMKIVYSIPKERVESAIEHFRRQMSYWDNREQDVPPSRPLRFLALARQALRKGRVSTGRYAQYVGISRREAATLVEQDVEQDAEIEFADL